MVRVHSPLPEARSYGCLFSRCRNENDSLNLPWAIQQLRWALYHYHTSLGLDGEDKLLYTALGI